MEPTSASLSMDSSSATPMETSSAPSQSEPSTSTPPDLYAQISSWVDAQKKANLNASDVIDALGLHLLPRGDETEETRWVLAALAAIQYRDRSRPRKALAELASSSLQPAIDLIQRSRRILIVSGAGASPRMGGYEAFYSTQLTAAQRQSLPDASLLFEAAHFVHQPQPFVAYMRTLLTGDRTPSAAHRLIRGLEEKGQLLNNYTQNVDNIEADAGIERVVPCHGSIASVACLACGAKVSTEEYAKMLEATIAKGPDLYDESEKGSGAAGDGAAAAAAAASSGGSEKKEPPTISVPRCKVCTHELNLLRPEISFLSELTSIRTEAALKVDLQSVDLLLVVGASLAAEPLKSLPAAVHHTVPQILIGPCVPPALKDHAFDVELVGNCDTICAHLGRALGLGEEAVAAAEPTHEPPNRFRFAAPSAADGAAPVTNGSSSAEPQMPPPQTPLAMYPLPTPLGGGKKKGARERGEKGFSGATLAGSGVGARASLSSTLPISNASVDAGTTTKVAGFVAGQAEVELCVPCAPKAEEGGGSAGKRPMPPPEEGAEPPPKA